MPCQAHGIHLLCSGHTIVYILTQIGWTFCLCLLHDGCHVGACHKTCRMCKMQARGVMRSSRMLQTRAAVSSTHCRWVGHYKQTQAAGWLHVVQQTMSGSRLAGCNMLEQPLAGVTTESPGQVWCIPPGPSLLPLPRGSCVDDEKLHRQVVCACLPMLYGLAHWWPAFAAGCVRCARPWGQPVLRCFASAGLGLKWRGILFFAPWATSLLSANPAGLLS